MHIIKYTGDIGWPGPKGDEGWPGPKGDTGMTGMKGLFVTKNNIKLLIN